MKDQGRMSRRAGQWVKQQLKLAVDPGFRRLERDRREEFLRFKQAFGHSLRHRLNQAGCDLPRALVVSSGFAGAVKMELGLIKGLELAGFEPVVLTWRDPWLVRYYELAGVERFRYWDEFLGPSAESEVRQVVQAMRSSDELIRFEWEGIRVGRFTAATTLRQLRLGSLNLEVPDIRRQVTQRLAAALAYARAAKAIIAEIRQALGLFVDRGYTPQGELFDACLDANVDALTWNTAHKSNGLILKRYSRANRDEHPVSLSSESWEAVCQMPWTDAHRQRLQQEIIQTYASGDWYSEVGTQFNTRLVEAHEVRHQFQLDPQKKTAVIFAHILWDGTFFWGEDLFSSYEEWLMETLRAACANTSVNWIMKLHPANRTKNVRDGVSGEPAELIALRRSIGTLPPHIRIMPPESEINNLSLLPIMDYVLTVRGTIGIEAASFGTPVLTAGTGRYDHKGFTIDSESREEYLGRLAAVQDIPPLSPAQRELAERFAYGVFVLRPMPFTTMTIEYQRDARATCAVRINAVTKEDWLAAPDLKAFATWVADSTAQDFLTSELNHDEPANAGR